MQVTGSLRRHARRIGRAVAAAGMLAMLWPAAADALFIVNEPWIRPAAAGADAECFVVLTSTDGATLVGVRTNLAERVLIEQRDSARRGKFRAVARLPLPPGETVMLMPNADRLRLLSIKRTLKLGERVALVLTIEASDGATQDIPFNAEVRRRSPTDDEMHAHGHAAHPGGH